MNKLMLEEINRISEIMGVKQKLINEQASIVDDVLDFVAKSPDPKLRSGLDDFVSKAGKAEYKTLDDLIRDSGKIDIEKVVPGITRKILDAGMKVAPNRVKTAVLNSIFSREILADLITFDKGALSQDEFNLLYNRIEDTIDKISDQQILDILTDSKTVQRVINGLPKEAKVKYTIPGGRSVKTGSEVAGDIKVADDVGKGVDDAAKGSDEVASSVEEIASPKMKIEPPVELTDEELNNFVSNADFSVEEVANDLTENAIYKSFQEDPRFKGISDAEKQKLVDEVTARVVEYGKLNGENNELIEKAKLLWENPKTPPSLKEKLIQDSFLSAKIKYSPKMKQFWINYLMGLNPSTGVSKNWWERWRRFMGFNAIFTGVGFFIDFLKYEETSLDELPGDTFVEKIRYLFKPGYSILKTVIPFGQILVPIASAFTADFKPPTKDQIFKLLGGVKGLYQNVGDVTLEPSADNNMEHVRRVIRNSDGANLGEYYFDNKQQKIVKYKNGDVSINQPAKTKTYANDENGLKDFLQNGDPNTTDAWGTTDFDNYWEKLEETFDYNGKTFYKIKIKGQTDPKTMYQYMYFDNGQFKYQ